MLGWYHKTDTDKSYILSSSRHAVTRRYTNTEVDKMRSKNVPGHATEVCTGGEELQFHSCLTSALVGGACSVSGPSRLTPEKESQCLMERWRGGGGGGACLNILEIKKKNLLILPRSEPRAIQWRSKTNTAASPATKNSNISACSSVPLKQICRINAL
jgi:hypothetical protein